MFGSAIITCLTCLDKLPCLAWFSSADINGRTGVHGVHEYNSPHVFKPTSALMENMMPQI
jgi:hypothetical protein